MNEFLTWLTIGKVGLILNTIGAVILALGSNKVMDVLTKFVDTVTPTYGTHGQGSVVPIVKQLGDEFNNVKKVARMYNLIGYLIFIIGFVLQLIFDN